MSAVSSSRRVLLAASAAATAVSLLPIGFAAMAQDNTVRPFKLSIPDEALADLRRRIAAWPLRKPI